MGKIWHNPSANRVSHEQKNDGNRFGGFPCGYGSRRGERDDCIHVQASQFLCQLSKPLSASFCPSSFEDNIAPFGVPEFAQPIPCRRTHRRFRRAGQQNAQVPYLSNRPLCARRERPRRRAAEERHELAPPDVEHGISSLPSFVSLAQRRWQVLGPVLSRSESRRSAAALSVLGLNIAGHSAAARRCTARFRPASCRLRVKLGGQGSFSTRPVIPNDRTLPVLTASSGMCQQRSFDHLVGGCQKNRRHRQV